MKRAKYLVIPAICLAFLTQQVQADEETVKKHIFSFDLENSYFIYKEPGVMKERGVMYGLGGSYTYNIPFASKSNKLFITAEVRSLWGKLDYKSSESGEMNKIPERLVEPRFLGGYSIEVGKSSLASYTGLGYRYLKDDSAGKLTSTGAFGYKRESNYFYIPIGIELLLPTFPFWKTKIGVEYDWFIRGKQYSYISGLPTGDGTIFVENAKNIQKSGYSIKSSIILTTKGINYGLNFGPFFNYWNIKKSKIDTIRDNLGNTYIGYEPKNESTEIGLKLGVNF